MGSLFEILKGSLGFLYFFLPSPFLPFPFPFPSPFFPFPEDPWIWPAIAALRSSGLSFPSPSLSNLAIISLRIAAFSSSLQFAISIFIKFFENMGRGVAIGHQLYGLLLFLRRSICHLHPCQISSSSLREMDDPICLPLPPFSGLAVESE